MADTLQKRASVEWIQKGSLGVMSFPSLYITRDGFMIDDGKSKSNILGGEVDVAFNNGYLFITRKMDGKAIFKCPGVTPNVYPGRELGRVTAIPPRAASDTPSAMSPTRHSCNRSRQPSASSRPSLRSAL
jgi:hypothetical protein